MYLENESCRMNVPGGCLFLRALQVIRASGRKGVPPHRASQHVGTDLISASSLAYRAFREDNLSPIDMWWSNET
jgi:hypothetical protein